MKKGVRVEDIMTKKMISVRPDTPMAEANDIISKHNFNGLPVVDEKNKLLGIITEYDLIAKGSNMHLPTFQKLVSELKISKSNKSLVENLKELRKLTVKDIMNKDPLTLLAGAPFMDALKAFQKHHKVNPIIVVDKNNKALGIVSRCDVLKLLVN